MRLLSRLAVASTVAALSLSTFVPLASANHVKDVLGDSASISEINFPGLASGPGFILPDSKFYGLDKLVQELRFVLAFTPEQQAKVRMGIAGERLAEAKVMMQRGDVQGLETALSGFEREVAGAAKSLADAGAKGRGTADQARKMNQTLADYRIVLRTVSEQAPTSLSYRIGATNQRVLEAKLRVEDELPGDELAMEIESDLQSEIESEVLGVQSAANSLMNKYAALESKSNFSAEQKMKYEELMASKSALRKDLLEQRKKLQEGYLQKRKELQEERKKLYEQIKELLKQLQENNKAMRELEKSYKAAYNGATLTPTVTPSSPGN
ncbi:MAG: hypothetical protein HYV40_04870 [Candidatus Levybacteria bacterium]|nr:hypothetical protein [Candidatus Levybacteria bacterium]